MGRTYKRETSRSSKKGRKWCEAKRRTKTFLTGETEKAEGRLADKSAWA